MVAGVPRGGGSNESAGIPSRNSNLLILLLQLGEVSSDRTMFSVHSYANLCVIFFGYIIYSLSLQLVFFAGKSHPEKRQAHHFPLILLNLSIASAFAFTTTELCIRGYSKMSFGGDFQWSQVIGSVVLACIYENALEYYWHRFEHTKFFYSRVHKVHHFYKQPRPFDDMYMHPIEVLAASFIHYYTNLTVVSVIRRLYTTASFTLRLLYSICMLTRSLSIWL